MPRALLLLLLALRLPAAPPERWTPADKPWDRSLGSHRVILKVGELPATTKAVAARMEWRRPDKDPEKKAVLVFDVKNGKQVTNVAVEKVTAEEGVITFEPVSGAGEYAVYFLPVKIEGGAFPVSKYTPPQQTAAEAWLKEQAAAQEKPRAEVARWEAISAHDAWTEMEVIATEAEAKAMAQHWKDGVALIVPPKNVTVRMSGRLSRRLVDRGTPVKAPTGAMFDVVPGEPLVFQIAAWSPTKKLEGVQVKFVSGNDFTKPAGPVPAELITCLDTERVDWHGRKSSVPLTIAPGEVRALNFSVTIPKEAAGASSMMAVLTTADGGWMSDPTFIVLNVQKDAPAAAVNADADPQSLSRLRWLNSTTAVDDEPVKGYEPLTVNGRTVRCLGRELELGEDGLPVQIRSYFNKAVTKVMEKPTVEMLAKPLEFNLHAIDRPGPAKPNLFEPHEVQVRRQGGKLKFTSQKAGVVEWEGGWETELASVALYGRMEFDGSVRYRLTLAAKKNVEFTRASLSQRMFAAPLGLGLQYDSGRAPGIVDWKWDVANKHQDSLWLGTVNGGLRVQLKSDNYVRPSVNIHYKRRPLNDPPSWNAGGRGSILMTREHEGVRELFTASGPFTLQPGKPLHFDFDLLITPFHTLRTKEQWADRYYHTGGVPQDYQKYLDGAKTAGANVVNIHQGNWLNPYINYPFLTADKLGAFAKAAHDRGMRAKYYYTVRELSNWCPELFAFRSMGDEILMSGKGGGHPWGEEHLGGNYWGAWYEPGVQDVSYLTQPMSRLHNYYVEGLRWLCENAGCDGIYLDDISYDRAIMLRARKVLDRHCPRGGLIDLHSWNEFHEGGAWAHCANIFMDSMPFVDRLWFGEGHHYTGPPPEHFLVELSGIPFGLMGEMLEGGGNPWFGLVHGMTGRLGWQGDPRAVWKLWNDFGVQDAEFIGWWAEEECPVRCDDPLVKATVWKKNDATLVAVANFSNAAKPAALTIDWQALGRDPAKAKLYAPPIPQLKQRAALLAPDQPVLLKPYAGAVFILDEKDHALEAAAPQAALGAVLMDEDFTRGLDKSWQPVLSPHAKDGGKLDAGYVLQVPANVHAYLERTIPAEAGAISARIWQDGKDEAQQWGPGLALVWPDGKTLRASIRKDGRLTVSANGSENLDAAITARAPIEFTIRWDKDSVKITAAGPAMGDLPEELATFPRAQFPGQPSVMRVGKMPNHAGPQDFGEPGAVGFNRIEWVRVFQQTR